MWGRACGHKPRPRGRAPKGKRWDGTGRVSAGTGEGQAKRPPAPQPGEDPSGRVNLRERPSAAPRPSASSPRKAGKALPAKTKQSDPIVSPCTGSDGEQAQLDDPPPGKDEKEQADDQEDDLADLRSLPLDGWTVHHDSGHDEGFWWHAATQRSSWTHPATGLFPDGSSHQNPAVAELAQQRQRELSRKSDRGGGGGGAAAAAQVRTKRPQAAQGSAPIRTKRPIAKVDGSATAAPIRTKRPMPQVGRDPFGRGGARPRHARPFGGRGQKANQSAAPPVQNATTAGKENAFEECPHCPPGSGKPKGHVGRHIGAQVRVGGTQSAKREGAGKPPPPKRRREDEQDSSSEPPIDKGTVRRAPVTDHDATQLVGTRIEYNLSRVWQGGVVASAIKKEGCEGWMNVVR